MLPSSTALTAWLEREQAQFATTHPRSLEFFRRGQAQYLYGAPSHWMRRWAGGFPFYVERAAGSQLHCVDGHSYVDFCLGDSGGMCGHGHPAITAAIADQLGRGATFMLPTPDAEPVGVELQRRFSLPYWGFTTSASDANRAVIRIARMITGRRKVLVFSGCYHGSVEEAHVVLDGNRVVMRNGIHPNAVHHDEVSVVVEFNDLAALEAELKKGDVACVLTEPVMTNYGMIDPAPGFHEGLRRLTREYGSLLIIDETHTFSNGPGGYSALHGLTYDFFVVGKSIGGGIPVGVYGVSEAAAQALWALVPKVNPVFVRQSSHLGFGGTLAGSALQVAAVRVVLEKVLTLEAFEHMLGLADRLADGARTIIGRAGLPWYVAHSGARVETMYAPEAPRNAADVAAGRNGLLEALLHVYFLNRGVVITPFHSMMLMCPATRREDIDHYLAVLGQFAADCVAGGRA